MFDKILIANRGEIALRIIRSCRELGIRTVAVYSECDADSLHVRFADEDICIGPPPSAQSYLNIANIISAAEISDAEAIHPGYGFLAENPRFAATCKKCDIRFIGPSASVIEQMGDKARAKQSAQAAGVPVMPGSDGPTLSVEAGLKAAKECGFPVLVKASAGGGGRGMRLAHTPSEFEASYHAASGEALTAFGDGKVYVEKYLHNPKHIEVQIMADEHGAAVHVGERDCSIQRRRQKLIEETPCALLPETIRQKMFAAALKMTKAVGYSGAGTIEFLWDRREDFYFIEMNTRLQVEHPVSEMVSLWDLVKEQISIASGEPLTRNQEQIILNDHALECRINAEDPARGFIPSPGKVTTYHQPGGPGVRVDSHAYQEYVVPSYYDSMLGKVIVRSQDRPEAIRRMKRCLDEYVIEGLKATIPFHLEMMENARFQSGDFGIHFIEEDFGL